MVQQFHSLGVDLVQQCWFIWGLLVKGVHKVVELNPSSVPNFQLDPLGDFDEAVQSILMKKPACFEVRNMNARVLATR